MNTTLEKTNQQNHTNHSQLFIKKNIITVLKLEKMKNISNEANEKNELKKIFYRNTSIVLIGLPRSAVVYSALRYMLDHTKRGKLKILPRSAGLVFVRTCGFLLRFALQVPLWVPSKYTNRYIFFKTFFTINLVGF